MLNISVATVNTLLQRVEKVKTGFQRERNVILFSIYRSLSLK